MKTAMQELKSDLVLTKETTKNSFLEIENQEIREVCIGVVEITLNAIVKRIDTELLAMEKEQVIKHSLELAKILISNPYETSGKMPTELIDSYINKTFKSE
jgi:hypothetical protein